MNQFDLGYFSMLDASEEIFTGFLDIVLTKYISECLTAFNVSVEYLYGMPYKVDQTGVLMDAAKVILNPFRRDGDEEVQRHFQTLTGFEGSYWEHNLFELWLRLPSISTIKALEIAKVEGIPIYVIDSTNIDTILPLLDLPDDLKQEIKNLVNIGYEVKVSESEIQFIDWEGAGYIIRDPETGTGAYKISGGYAGGGSGEEKPTNCGAILKILYLMFSRASVISGQSKWYEAELSWMISALFAWKVLFSLWYLPTLKVHASKNCALKEIAKSNNKVFYYIGHGDVGYTGHAELTITHEEAITVGEITNAVGNRKYKFVFLNCCLSAVNDHELGKAFNSDACVGWEGSPISLIAVSCGWDFFYFANTGLFTVKQIFDMLHTLPIYSVYGISFWGDGDFKL